MGFWKDLLDWLNNSKIYYKSIDIELDEDELDSFREYVKNERKKGLITIAKIEKKK